MTKKTLKIAKREARRFLERVLTLEDRVAEEGFAIYGCKELLAVERASMDLTRALAEMRKPEHAFIAE